MELALFISAIFMYISKYQVAEKKACCSMVQADIIEGQ